ncbi:inositol monophosphatase [bacterium]|nr:inositol monophosphatase [bacterium]
MERYKKSLEIVKINGEFLKKEVERREVLKTFRYDTKLVQDIESEKKFLSFIEKNFPDDGWITEESGEKKSSSGYTWIIDPLDGTVNYSKGIPHCAISVACIGEKEKFGIVYDFFREELFTGIDGEGAFLNGKRINVSSVEKLEDAIMSAGFWKGKKEIETGFKIFMEFSKKVKKIRMMGSAALEICYVACGRFDMFIEFSLHIWDIAAGKIILEQAGGSLISDKINGIEIFIGTNAKLKELMEKWKDRQKE